MSGRIARIPFHFLVGNLDSRPVRDDALAIGNDGDILIALDLEAVGFVSVSFAAARDGPRPTIVEMGNAPDPLGRDRMPTSVIYSKDHSRPDQRDHRRVC